MSWLLSGFLAIVALCAIVGYVFLADKHPRIVGAISVVLIVSVFMFVATVTIHFLIF